MAKPDVTRRELLEERDATMDHRVKVFSIMQCVANQINVRGKVHDRSKLSDAELPYFAKATSLKKTAYGTKEYEKSLASLGPALKHHYANNRHHPEHHKNGIPDMNLVDVVEMLCDWLAAGLRHGPGHDIFRSINHNRMRFRIKKDLANIMWNTALDIFGEEPEDGYEMCLIAECQACGTWQDPQNQACVVEECECTDLREV